MSDNGKDNGNGKGNLLDMEKRLEDAEVAKMIQATIKEFATNFPPVVLADTCFALFLGLQELQARMEGQALAKTPDNAKRLLEGCRQLIQGIEKERGKVFGVKSGLVLPS